MDPHRLQDKADARRFLHEMGKQPQTPRHVATADEVKAPTGAGSAELIAEGDDRIELDPAEIAAADAELARRHDELSELLAQAKELEAPLRDGSGPVATHLRRAFGLRGSADTGVQATLRDYLDELATLREAIRRAGAGHQAADDEARDSLRGFHRDAGS
ncbi:hypothetical protein [Amycolatopsis taiwanensis]|uniref:hypothetical protein n=1 Tax=Amycolatopsis taiwanensis TaxID=342230 RepID=UPI00048998D5|nr:hypothetical protein [Amycolatopsis taiwanensis]